MTFWLCGLARPHDMLKRTGLPILLNLLNLLWFFCLKWPYSGGSLSYSDPRLWISQSCSFGFISFFWSSIWSTMAFLPSGNSDHVVVSVSIDFLSYSQQDAPFPCIAYDYSCADWVGLHDHLRDVPWEDIFKFSASAAASGFCEWVLVGIDV